MSTYYPVAFPLLCLRKIKDIIQAGEVVARRAELLKCWWKIEGFTYRTFVGDPDEPSQYVSTHEDGTEEETKQLCCDIAKLCGKPIVRSESEASWSVDRYLSTMYVSLWGYMDKNRVKIIP